MAPVTITISEATPNPNHDRFTVVFDTNHLIHTTVTADPSVVTSWISSLSTTTNTSSPLLVGLDIEWRPNFGRGFDNPVATVQLCTTTSCLIFQILHCPPPLPPSLSDFLSHENVIFAGVGIRSDVEQLLADYNLAVKNTVDLGDLAAEKIVGARKGMGLKELARIVMEVEVQKPKRVTLSRWDYEWLSYGQIQYACIDAFLSFEIAKKLMALPAIKAM